MILPFILLQIAPDVGLLQFGCYDAHAMGICAAFNMFSSVIIGHVGNADFNIFPYTPQRTALEEYRCSYSVSVV
jgi:hypothetical protein